MEDQDSIHYACCMYVRDMAFVSFKQSTRHNIIEGDSILVVKLQLSQTRLKLQRWMILLKSAHIRIVDFYFQAMPVLYTRKYVDKNSNTSDTSDALDSIGHININYHDCY